MGYRSFFDEEVEEPTVIGKTPNEEEQMGNLTDETPTTSAVTGSETPQSTTNGTKTENGGTPVVPVQETAAKTDAGNGTATSGTGADAEGKTKDAAAQTEGSKPAETTVPTIDERKAEIDAQTQKQVKTYQDMISRYPTGEVTEADKKRAKRETLFAAISDGLGALASLWGATKGAGVTYDPEKSASQKVAKNWREWLEKRSGERKEYAKAQMEMAEKIANAQGRAMSDKNKINEGAAGRQATANENEKKRRAAAEENEKKREATANENDKRIKSQEKIAKERNAATINAANTRAAATRASKGTKEENKNKAYVNDSSGNEYIIAKSEVARLYNKLKSKHPVTVYDVTAYENGYERNKFNPTYDEMLSIVQQYWDELDDATKKRIMRNKR